jgi:integrase
MARKPLAPGTIHTRFTNVRSVFRAAVADRVIGADPTDHVMLPRRRRTEAAMSIPTSAEVGRMLAAAGEEFAPYVAVCAFGGLRLGEAAALQVDDIDFMRRTLTVSRQVQRERAGEVEIRPPKYGSERVVFIPEELAQLLNRHVIEHLPDFAPERWLFTGSVEGVPPHQNAIGHRWRMTLERAGLAGRYRLHDLRHYCASGLIAAGCDVVTVQRALGHRSATTTLNTYSHLCPTAEDRTRMAAAGLLAEASAAADEYLTNARATTRG